MENNPEDLTATSDPTTSDPPPRVPTSSSSTDPDPKKVRQVNKRTPPENQEQEDKTSDVNDTGPAGTPQESKTAPQGDGVLDRPDRAYTDLQQRHRELLAYVDALRSQAEHDGRARQAQTAQEQALVFKALSSIANASGRAPYVPPTAIRVPHFEGKRPIKFLKDYSRYALDQGWNDQQRTSRVADHCASAISRLVNDSNPQRDKTWNEVKDFFRQTWGDAAISTELSRVDTCRMTDDDTVMAWYTRIQTVFQDVDDDRMEWNLVNATLNDGGEHEMQPVKEREKVAKMLQLVHPRYFKEVNRTFDRHSQLHKLLQALQREERVYRDLLKRSDGRDLTHERPTLPPRASRTHLKPLVRGVPNTQVKQDTTVLTQTWHQTSPDQGPSGSSNEGKETQIQEGIDKFVAEEKAKLSAKNAKLQLELDRAKRTNQKMKLDQMNKGSVLAPFTGLPTGESFCVHCRDRMDRPHKTVDCPECCSRCAGRHTVLRCHRRWQDFECEHCGSHHHSDACPWVFFGVPSHLQEIARKKKSGTYRAWQNDPPASSNDQYSSRGRGRGRGRGQGRGREPPPYLSPKSKRGGNNYRNNKEFFSERERTGRTDDWSKKERGSRDSHRHHRSRTPPRARSRERRSRRSPSPHSRRAKDSRKSPERSPKKARREDSELQQVAQQAAQIALLGAQQPQPPIIPTRQGRPGQSHPIHPQRAAQVPRQSQFGQGEVVNPAGGFYGTPQRPQTPQQPKPSISNSYNFTISPGTPQATVQAIMQAVKQQDSTESGGATDDQ